MEPMLQEDLGRGEANDDNTTPKTIPKRKSCHTSLMSPPSSQTLEKKFSFPVVLDKGQGSPSLESAYSSSYGKSPQVEYTGKWTNTPGLMTPGYSSGFETESPGCLTPMPNNPIFKFLNVWSSSATCGNVIEILRRNYIIIKQDFTPDDELLDKCYGAGIIADEFFDKIRESRKKRNRASDLFVKALVDFLSKGGNEEAMNREHNLRRILEKNGYRHFLQTADEEKESPCDNLLTNTQCTALLDSNIDVLLDDLEPRHIIDELLVLGMLSFDDHEDLLTMDYRHTRVKFFINYVKHNIDRNFPLFQKVLKKHRPKLEQKLMCPNESTATAEQASVLPQLQLEGGSFKPISEFGEGDYRMEVKFNFSAREETQDIEMETVENNSMTINLALEQEAMECDTTVEGYSYSSIIIHLKAMSPSSASKMNKAIQRNSTFVRRWIEKLIPKEKLIELTKRGLQNITIEVTVEQIDANDQECTCIASRETVVKSFSKIAEELREVGAIIKAILKLIPLTSEQKISLQPLLDSSSLEDEANEINEEFLTLLLKFPERCMCVFEMMLIETKQHNILKIIEKDHALEKSDITIKDIEENASYICEEIEPRHFVNVLKYIEATAQETKDGQKIQDKIISNDRRATRSRELINFLLQSDETATRTFVRELDRLNLLHIKEILLSSRDAESTKQECYKTKSLRARILSVHGSILDEIDADDLQTTFMERNVFTDEECKHIYESDLSIKEKNVLLMKMVLNSGYKAMVCLVDSFKVAGYDNLVTSIQTANVEHYSGCPTLPRKEHKRDHMKYQFAIIDNLEESVFESQRDTRIQNTQFGVLQAEVEIDDNDIRCQNMELQALDLLQETQQPEKDIPNKNVPTEKMKTTCDSPMMTNALYTESTNAKKTSISVMSRQNSATAQLDEVDKEQYVNDWVMSCTSQKVQDDDNGEKDLTSFESQDVPIDSITPTFYADKKCTGDMYTSDQFVDKDNGKVDLIQRNMTEFPVIKSNDSAVGFGGNYMCKPCSSNERLGIYTDRHCHSPCGYLMQPVYQESEKVNKRKSKTAKTHKNKTSRRRVSLTSSHVMSPVDSGADTMSVVALTPPYNLPFHDNLSPSCSYNGASKN